MAAIDKVKVLVVGDSGVGKSSLVHLICHNEPISNPSWTIGCAVDVKLHEYKEGTPQQNPYFVEMWDVGGSSSHRNARFVFYNGVNGVILVHDLTNRKSHQNLHRWLSEILNKGGCPKSRGSFDEYDPEQFVGSPQIPILVIGTKLDLVDEARPQQYKRIASVAEECGADEIFLDCNEVKSLAPGSSSAVKLTRFYDKVIEQRYRTSREKTSPFVDSRRLYPHSPKYYHAD